MFFKNGYFKIFGRVVIEVLSDGFIVEDILNFLGMEGVVN